MDKARPATKKAKPKRANIVVISFLLGCVVSTAYVVAVNRYKGHFSRIGGILSKQERA
jgi:LPS O-antigen subunit length determinant protein (WzzB/FepE family)